MASSDKRRNGRDGCDADHQARHQHVETRQVGQDGRLQQGRDEQQREVAEHDGRHGRDQFQHGLDDLAQGVRRKLRQIDRDHRAHRHGDEHGNDGDGQRAGDQRQDAVLRVGEQRRPDSTGEEIPDRDEAEEADRLVNQDERDRHRGEHGDQAAPQQHQFDGAFLDVARVLVLQPHRIDRCRRRHWIGDCGQAASVGVVVLTECRRGSALATACFNVPATDELRGTSLRAGPGGPAARSALTPSLPSSSAVRPSGQPCSRHPSWCPRGPLHGSPGCMCRPWPAAARTSLPTPAWALASCSTRQRP
jgi:hypothetical protein